MVFMHQHHFLYVVVNHQPKYGNNQCIFVPKFIMHEYPFFRHFCYSVHYAHFFKSKCIARFAFAAKKHHVREDENEC